MKQALIAFYLLFVAFSALAQADSVETAKHNYISIGQEYSWFDASLANWNTTVIEGKFKKEQWVLLPRFYIANRFGKTGWLLEQDIYKKTKKGNYFFFQAGGSSTDIFPNIKLAAEYFHPFSKTWEVSGGIKYLKFADDLEVGITTASISHYYGKFLTIARGYVGTSSNQSGISNFSGSLIQRYYHTESAYTSVFANYGYDPNILLFDGNTNISIDKLVQFSLGINRLQEFSKRISGLFQAEYTHYNFGVSTRNQYTVSAKLIYYTQRQKAGKSLKN